MDKIDAMAERIGRLERANRRMAAALAASLLVGFAVVALGAGGHGAKDIEAQRITLRDSSGEARAELGITPVGPRLIFFDAGGMERFCVEPAVDGCTVMRIATGEGGSRRSITLRAAPDGWSTLSFSDDERRERLALGLAYDGEPRLRMYTPEGRSRVSLGSDMSGRAELVIHDTDGSERAVLKSGPGGPPSLDLYGGNGEPVFAAP